MMRTLLISLVLLLAVCDSGPAPRICTARSTVCRFVVFLKDGTFYRAEGPSCPRDCQVHVRVYELLYGDLFKGACIEEDQG